jgi:hypothetical protein
MTIMTARSTRGLNIRRAIAQRKALNVMILRLVFVRGSDHAAWSQSVMLADLTERDRVFS